MNLSSLMAIALSLVLLLSICFVCVTMTGRPSEAKKKRQKEKRKRKRLDHAYDDYDTTSLPTDVPTRTEWIEADDISYEDLVDTYLDQYAHPYGFESFIDKWPQSRMWDGPDPGELLIVRDKHSDEIIYYIQGGALIDEGVCCDTAYSEIINLPYCVKANMAHKRGCAHGKGFIGAMGIRYRYTEPDVEKGGREKVAATASQDDDLYNSVLPAVQRVANSMVAIVERWGVGLKAEMQAQRKFMRTVLPASGTASHTFPMASIGIQGLYGAHWDKRDTRTTLWGSLKSGGLAFPSYRHVQKLRPGDVLGFNGKDHMHANVVYPCDVDEAANLPSELKNMIVCLYFQSQQGSYFSNAYNATHEDHVDKDGEIISDLHSDIDDVHGSVDAPQPPVDTVRLRNIAARLGLMEEMRRNSTNIR